MALPLSEFAVDVIHLNMCSNIFNAVLMAVGMSATVVWGVILRLALWQLVYFTYPNNNYLTH